MDKTIEIMYIRLNEFSDYLAEAGKTITKGKLDWIAYGLVVETGQYQEYWRTWKKREETDKTWMESQAHFIKAQEDLCNRKQNSHQGGYTDGDNNLFVMQDEFSNLEQSTPEDWLTVTNLMSDNTTLIYQVVLYENHL